MAVLEITSRQFREKQKHVFDLVDKGEEVIIRRGRKQAYILTPIQTEDMQISPKLEKKIQRALQDIKEGKATTVKTKEELKMFLDSL